MRAFKQETKDQGVRGGAKGGHDHCLDILERRGASWDDEATGSRVDRSMLISEGQDRTFSIDRRLACLMALVAGGLNSAGFYAVGFFSANMTGNASAMADHIALGDVLIGAFYLMIVAIFVLGAALSAFVTSAGKRKGVKRIYAFNIIAEAALLTLLGCADLWLSPTVRGPTLVFGLSFLMGVQNAIVTRISDARVRATHVSGMATDIGIELGCLAEIALYGENAGVAQSYREKLALHGATVLSFCIGGIIGVFTYKAVGAWLLFGASMLLTIAALPALKQKDRRIAPATPF